MNVTHLECAACAARYEARLLHNLCTECGKPLLVRYDLKSAAASLTKESLRERGPDLWRYREVLPVEQDENIVTLGEGFTPLVRASRLGAQLGLSNLYIKDEGQNPTQSFKARGMAAAVSMAKELGAQKLAVPSAGNAAGALAAYAARAGLEAHIFMPSDTPRANVIECEQTGAQVTLMDGLITDCGAEVGRRKEAEGWFDVSTLKEPYRIEGKKTMGYEIAEQYGWEVPDVILYPTGGGVGIIGIYKALRELQALGWIGERLPRLVAVQAEGCAPIVRAWQQGRADSELWQDSHTVAFGINVPKALGDFLVLDAVRSTGGCAIAVSDEDLLQAQEQLARREGLFVCPEGAATFAAALQLRQQGWIKANERVLLLNTGSGLGYPETVQSAPPVLQQQDDL
jgi:threonine synthase